MATLNATNLKHASSSSNNIVLNSNGSVSIPNLTRTPAAGETIETIAGIADGRSITVGSGSYTLGNVTASQALTATYTEITGSAISYKPPSGAKQLIYSFLCQYAAHTNSGISHFYIQVDSGGINPSRITKAGEHVSTAHHHSQLHMEWVFDLTETSNDIANGKLAGSLWTTNKTIRVLGREFDGSSYNSQIHKNDYWDGGGATGSVEYVKPRLLIQAIA